MAVNVKFFLFASSLLIVYLLLVAFHASILVLDESGCRLLGVSYDCYTLNNVVYYSVDVVYYSVDIVLFVLISVLLFVLAHRDERRFRRVDSQIRRITEDMETIVEVQGQMREKRTTYVVQSLKNHMEALLLSIDTANRIADDKMDGGSKARLEAALIEAQDSMQKIGDTLEISIDLLDPMLAQQIETLVKATDQRLVGGLKKGKASDYSWLKKDVESIANRLDGYMLFTVT